MSVTQEEDAPRRVDPQKVFPHGPLFLAAKASFLLSRVVGARDGALGAVLTTRGATGAGAAQTASAGEASSGRENSSTPRRARQASTRRQGASSKVRRVCRHTGSQT
jgi:hypothetical protein